MKLESLAPHLVIEVVPNCLSACLPTTSNAPAAISKRGNSRSAGRCPSANTAGPSGGLVDRIIVSGAPALGDDSRWAGDLLECDAWVVGTAEPVEAPIAARLQRLGERIARAARGHPAVLLAPALGGRPVLVRAGIKETYATTWDLG